MNVGTDFSGLLPVIERFSDVKLLCIGDIMLDRFVYGSVDRISPEAPIPVMKQTHESSMLGGAGNVVRNMVSLGAQCCFMSVVGDDAIGKKLLSLVGESSLVTPYILTQSGRRSTEKTRYIAGTQQLLRSDYETSEAISTEIEDQLIQLAVQEIRHYQLVIISDYGKGVLTDRVLNAVITAANERHVPVFVDPKRRDLVAYQGATLLSPNLAELSASAGDAPLLDDDAVLQAALGLMQQHHFQHMLITRGKDGMTWVDHTGAATHIPAQAREVFDVSGAGDTAMATLACAKACGLSFVQAAQLANMAAGIVVGRLGTATIFRTDLKVALHSYEANAQHAKIASRDMAALMVQSWKEQGLKVGFTNGCFDVLHVGHLQSLNEAKLHCDRLVVAINSDASVSRLKGPSRPINAEMDRATMMAALDGVDMVTIFREDTPETLIELLKPDVLMKGADYTENQVVGGDYVKSYGGRIVLLPLKQGYSSTTIIEKTRQTS